MKFGTFQNLFSMTQNKKNAGLFTEDINTFLKLKQQSSGWPSWVQTESDQETYIKMYEINEGILLDPLQIERNEGLRSLAKLFLVSFWGKFAQRDKIKKTLHVSEPFDFFKCITDESKIIKNIEFPTTEIAEIHFEETEDFIQTSNKTNIFIAAYTTAQARMKLYQILDILQKNVVYYDTDSIIYIDKPGISTQIQVGDFLGDLTNEIEPPNYICEFVSGGPKNYSYKLQTPDTSGNQYICKIKGISLNFSAAQKINFHSMKQLILHDDTNSIKITDPHKIKRNKKSTEIETVQTVKTYNFTYDKHIVKDDFITYPYGYF